MHPALSIIFFTVTTGLGFGWVAVGIGLHESALAPYANIEQALWTGVIALIVISAGLASSALHLANPKNFWRSFMRVRTSWLSREAVLAVAFYPFMLIYLVAEPESYLARFSGVLSVLIALVTVFSTGMIYACLRTIRQWNTALTPVNFLLMALALGAIAAAAQHALAGGSETQPVTRVALLFLMGAFVGKLCYYLKIGLPDSMGIDTATGFRMARVRSLNMGETPRSFLTDEFDYQVSRSKLLILKTFTLGVGFVIPGILLLNVEFGAGSAGVLFLALALAYAGALVERWLFFAEAQHVVRLYHGQVQT